MNLRALSDKDLLLNTKKLVARERKLFTETIHHLQEIQRCRLFSDLGCRSLWDYCMKHLGYSESQVKRTTDATKLIQEIPEVEAIIEQGDLSLSNVVAAQVHFRSEEKIGAPLSVVEKLEVIESLKNKSAREGEKILAEKASAEPAPVKDKIRRVTAKISEVKFGADDNLLENMEAVKGLLAHKHPRLNTKELMEIVFEMARDSLDPARKVRAEKKTAGEKVEVPKTLPPTSAVKREAVGERKYISVKIKREVWKEADSKCVKCKSNYALETDHNTPVSLGGSSSIENLRLLCRNCNQRAAIKKLGQKRMDQYLI